MTDEKGNKIILQQVSNDDIKRVEGELRALTVH